MSLFWSSSSPLTSPSHRRPLPALRHPLHPPYSSRWTLPTLRALTTPSGTTSAQTNPTTPTPPTVRISSPSSAASTPPRQSTFARTISSPRQRRRLPQVGLHQRLHRRRRRQAHLQLDHHRPPLRQPRCQPHPALCRDRLHPRSPLAPPRSLPPRLPQRRRLHRLVLPTRQRRQMARPHCRLHDPPS